MGNLIVDLMVENGFLEKDIKKLNELVKELEIQNKEVAKENKNLREQNGQLIHSYNRMKNELERANRERAKELQENSVLSNVINTYECSTNSLNYKIKQLTEELNKLKSKEYINDKWGRYENTINDLKRELNEYKARGKNYKRDLEHVEKLILSETDIKNTLYNQINKLKEDNERLKTKIKTLVQGELENEKR